MTVILSAILIVTVLLLLGSIVLLFLTFALAYYLGDVLGSLSLDSASFPLSSCY